MVSVKHYYLTFHPNRTTIFSHTISLPRGEFILGPFIDSNMTLGLGFLLKRESKCDQMEDEDITDLKG